MRIPTGTACAVGAAALVTVLMGCFTGNGSQATLPSATAASTRGGNGQLDVGTVIAAVLPGSASLPRQQFERDNSAALQLVGKQVVYVANFNGVVWLYPRRGKAPTGSITRGIATPTALALDSFQNVYVADAGTPRDVQVFTAGGSKLVRTYTDQIYDPQAIAVAPDDTVYVGDGSVNPSGNIPSGVAVFPPGSTTCSQYLVIDNGQAQPVGLVVDSKGNLFVNAFTGSMSQIYEFKKGSKSYTSLKLVGLGFVVGITFDQKGNLVVADETNKVIDIFPPGKTSPSQTINVNYGPDNIAFAPGDKELYVTNFDGIFEGISYPDGQLRETVRVTPWADGIAVGRGT